MTVQQIRQRVQAEGLLGGEGPVVAMLSGGRDSVCLLDVAVALCGAPRVAALHVNYGLRPEADGDERHCRELCQALGVGLEVVAASRDEQEGNLHAWAREVRYRAAARLAERLEGGGGPGEASRGQGGGGLGEASRGQGGDDPVEGFLAERGGGDVFVGWLPRARTRARAVAATGHTATDQVETILYRLAASPGRRALLGMAPREGRLVRPLLGFTREHTAAYCREQGLPWREDSSNDDLLYARARVRHGLLQALAAVHPAAHESVLRTARLLREETELLDGLVEAELGRQRTIALDRLQALPIALQRLIVIRLAEQAAGTLVPQAGERVGEIVELGRRGGRAELHVGGLVAAVVDGGVLAMVKIAPRAQHPPARAPSDAGDR